MPVQHSVLNVKALVGAINQEKALVGAFSVIVQLVVEPMDSFTALYIILLLAVLLTSELTVCLLWLSRLGLS